MRLVVILVIFLCAPATLNAQFRLGFNVDIYKPQSQFAENVSNSPVGFSISGIKRLPESRFSVGGDIGVAMYSNRTYDYELVEEGAEGEFIEIDEEDCFLHADAIARYSLYQTNVVEAYAEMKMGVYTFFSTRIAVDGHRLYDDQTEFHGTSFNTGLGTGMSVNMTNLFGGESRHPIFLDFNGVYSTGTRASYRNMGNEQGTVSGLDAGKYQSLINHLNFKVGISVQL